MIEGVTRAKGLPSVAEELVEILYKENTVATTKAYINKELDEKNQSFLNHFQLFYHNVELLR